VTDCYTLYPQEKQLYKYMFCKQLYQTGNIAPDSMCSDTAKQVGINDGGVRGADDEGQLLVDSVQIIQTRKVQERSSA